MRRIARSAAVAAGLLAGAVPAQVVFVSDAPDTASLRLGDVAIWSYLQTRYGPNGVIYRSTRPTGQPQLRGSDLLPYDVAVLSSVPSSADYRNFGFATLAMPIVNCEEAVAANRANEFSVTTDRPFEFEVDHKITIKTAHPITANLPLNTPIQIATGRSEVWWGSGPQAPGAVSLATDDDTATNLFLAYVDNGSRLLNGRSAPCRRVMFGLKDPSFTAWNAVGRQLFGQAIDWARGACCAVNENYGTGFPGTNGVPTIRASALAVFNTSISVQLFGREREREVAVLCRGPRARRTPDRPDHRRAAEAQQRCNPVEPEHQLRYHPAKGELPGAGGEREVRRPRALLKDGVMHRSVTCNFQTGVAVRMTDIHTSMPGAGPIRIAIYHNRFLVHFDEVDQSASHIRFLADRELVSLDSVEELVGQAERGGVVRTFRLYPAASGYDARPDEGHSCEAIVGNVRRAGDVMTDALVRLTPLGRNDVYPRLPWARREQHVDADGSFRIGPIPAGRYRLTCLAAKNLAVLASEDMDINGGAGARHDFDIGNMGMLWFEDIALDGLSADQSFSVGKVWVTLARPEGHMYTQYFPWFPFGTHYVQCGKWTVITRSDKGFFGLQEVVMPAQSGVTKMSLRLAAGNILRGRIRGPHDTYHIVPEEGGQAPWVGQLVDSAKWFQITVPPWCSKISVGIFDVDGNRVARGDLSVDASLDLVVR